MSIRENNVFGCGISALYNFVPDMYYDYTNEKYVTRKTIREQLNDFIKGRARELYHTKKFLCVVTDGQPEALKLLRSMPEARLLTQAQNYRYMNYVWEINTIQFQGPYLPKDNHRVPFRQTIKTMSRKGKNVKPKQQHKRTIHYEV